MTEIISKDSYFVYFGKHTSKNVNNTYLGSGVFVKSAKKNPSVKFVKHILSIQPSMELNAEFEELLVSKAKEKFSNCVNIAKGGIGGNLMPVHPMKGRKNPASEKSKIERSIYMKEKFKTQEHWCKNKPALHKRSSKIPWDKEVELYELWISEGMPKYWKFRNAAIRKGYPEVYYNGMVDSFVRKYNGN